MSTTRHGRSARLRRDDRRGPRATRRGAGRQPARLPARADLAGAV